MEDSGRVKKPSKAYIQEMSELYIDWALISNLWGKKTVLNAVDRDKKLESLGIRGLEEYRFFAASNDPELDPDELLINNDTLAVLKDATNTNDKEFARLVSLNAKKAADVSKLTYYDGMTRMFSAFEKSAEKGETMKQWVDRIGEDDVLQKIGFHSSEPWYLETVYRTNSTSAYNAGKYKESMSNEEIAMFEFIGIDDKRQTEICNAYNGMIRKKTDGVWSVATPSLHFQCRSEIVQFTHLAVEAFGVTETPKDQIPDSKIIPVKFRNNPATNNEWTKTSKTMKKRIKEYESAA